ncbi:hypothetical protein HK098_000158 [Nowakowskiella sp. JEL0407]|nr:hypothetical protein HK098_000158 [Nowakowskiella sp. JEL0407]
MNTPLDNASFPSTTSNTFNSLGEQNAGLEPITSTTSAVHTCLNQDHSSYSLLRLEQISIPEPKNQQSPQPANSPNQSMQFFLTTPEELRVQIERSISVPKRKRMKVTSEQTRILNGIYESGEHTPNPQRRNEIGDAIGMNSRAIQIWFQNRRAKAKKEGGSSSPSSIDINMKDHDLLGDHVRSKSDPTGNFSLTNTVLSSPVAKHLHTKRSTSIGDVGKIKRESLRNHSRTLSDTSISTLHHAQIQQISSSGFVSSVPNVDQSQNSYLYQQPLLTQTLIQPEIGELRRGLSSASTASHSSTNSLHQPQTPLLLSTSGSSLYSIPNASAFIPQGNLYDPHSVSAVYTPVYGHISTSYPHQFPLNNALQNNFQLEPVPAGPYIQGNSNVQIDSQMGTSLQNNIQPQLQVNPQFNAIQSIGTMSQPIFLSDLNTMQSAQIQQQPQFGIPMQHQTSFVQAVPHNSGNQQLSQIVQPNPPQIIYHDSRIITQQLQQFNFSNPPNNSTPTTNTNSQPSFYNFLQ